MLHLIDIPTIENLDVLSSGAFGQVCRVLYEGRNVAMKRAITPDDFHPWLEKEMDIKNGCCHVICREKAGISSQIFSSWTCQFEGCGSCFLSTCIHCSKSPTPLNIGHGKDTEFCKLIRRHPLMKEVCLLKFLSEKSPENFPSVYGLAKLENQIHYLFELADMDLEKFMKRVPNGSEQFRISLTVQLFQGIEFIHRCGFVHNDLKPKNILIKDGKQLKITDFGISMRDTICHEREINTIDYRPPECFLTKKLTFRKELDVHSPDLWASGLITHFIWTGRYLFSVPPQTANQTLEDARNTKIIMLLQIFLFWKSSASFCPPSVTAFQPDTPEFATIIDWFRNFILIPDGFCYYMFGEIRWRKVSQTYFNGVDRTFCKPFLEKFILPFIEQGKEITLDELRLLVQAKSKPPPKTSSVIPYDPIQREYYWDSTLFDHILHFIKNLDEHGNLKKNDENGNFKKFGEKRKNTIESIYTSQEFSKFTAKMKNAFSLLIDATTGGNELYCDVVLRLLSFNRFQKCKASDILQMLGSEPLRKDYQPLPDEFNCFYEKCLLQLHYQVL